MVNYSNVDVVSNYSILWSRRAPSLIPASSSTTSSTTTTTTTTTSITTMLLSEICIINLPEQVPEESTSIGTLFREVLAGFLCIFHQLIKGVESFDLFFVDQCKSTRLMCVSSMAYKTPSSSSCLVVDIWRFLTSLHSASVLGMGSTWTCLHNFFQASRSFSSVP